MGMITAIFVFIAALIGKVLSKLLEEEAKAWLPHRKTRSPGRQTASRG